MSLPNSFSIGPVTFYREAVLKLEHGIRFPLTAELFTLLASYDFPEEEAEHLAASGGFRPANTVRHSSRGTVFVLRASYPCAFIALMTEITDNVYLASFAEDGCREEDEHYSGSFYIGDRVCELEEAVRECATAPWFTIHCDDFGALVDQEQWRDAGADTPDAKCALIADPHEDASSQLASPCPPYRIDGDKLIDSNGRTLSLTPTEKRCMTLLLTPPFNVRFTQHRDSIPNYSQILSKLKRRIVKGGMLDCIRTPGTQGRGSAEGGEYWLGTV